MPIGIDGFPYDLTSGLLEDGKNDIFTWRYNS
jgi:hypothetical protein